MPKNNTQTIPDEMKEKLLKMTNPLPLIEKQISSVELQIRILKDDFLKRCRDNYTM